MKNLKIKIKFIIVFLLLVNFSDGQMHKTKYSETSKILINSIEGNFQFTSRSDTQWLYLYDSIKKINTKEILSISGGLDNRKMKFINKNSILFLKILDENKIVFYDKFAILKEPQKKILTIYIRSSQYNSYIVKSYLFKTPFKNMICIVNELEINNNKRFIKFFIYKNTLLPKRIEYILFNLNNKPTSVLNSELISFP